MAGGSVSCAKLLIQHSALVNARSQPGGLTPLHLAAAGAGGKANLACMLVLLQARAQLGIGNQKQWTPLHSAAYSGQDEAVKRLAHAGARLDAKTGGGLTAYDIAVGAAMPYAVACGVLLLPVVPLM